MGNICRSPTATGVFRELVRRKGLEAQVSMEGAGTHAFHVGEPPDPRTQQAALRRGVDLSDLRAQHVTPQLIAQSDFVFAMDERNLEALQAMAPSGHAHKPRLFLELVPMLGRREVPDPYYGGADGFEEVLDLCEQASEALLSVVIREHKLSA